MVSVGNAGQPLEVLKTQVAANRNQSLFTACAKIYARGGVRGFWQGLYPWALFEAVTKGGVLLLTQSEIQSIAVNGLGTSPQVGSALGGICGGVAQGLFIPASVSPCIGNVAFFPLDTNRAG